MQPEQQQRIMGYFIEEAKDHLNTIEQGLLNLQTTIEEPETVNELFRAAHSIKGGAAMLGLGSIQRVSHRLEDFFKVLKDTPIRPDQRLESLFLKVFDALQELIEQLQGPFGLTEEVATATLGGVEPVFGELEQHLATLAIATGGPAAHPNIEELGLEAAPAAVAATVAGSEWVRQFQTEVPNLLRDMLQLFKQSEGEAVRQQLQDICNHLVAIGGQFGLANWCQLLETAKQAIADSDNDFRTLAPIVIRDIKQAQDLVLAGRSSEITPCAQLLELLPVPAEEPELAASADLSNLLAETDLALSQGFPADLDLDLDLGGSPPSELSTLDDLFRPADLDLAGLDQQGPEVGMAELNSLADLFEGEMPDLGSTWQEEEILGEAVAGSGVSLTVSEDEESSDFSDLLFDTPGAETAPTGESATDDLSALFGDAFLEEESLSGQEDVIALGPLTPEPQEQQAPAMEDLFPDLSEGGGAAGLADLEFQPDLAAQLEAESEEASLNNLGALFAEIDDTDLPFTETPPDLSAALEIPAQEEVFPPEVSSPLFPEEPESPVAASEIPDPWAELGASAEAVPESPATLENLNLPTEAEAAELGSWIEPEAEPVPEATDLSELTEVDRVELSAAEALFDESTGLEDLFGQEESAGSESLRLFDQEESTGLEDLFGQEESTGLESLFGQEESAESESLSLFGQEESTGLEDLFGQEESTSLEDLFGQEEGQAMADLLEEVPAAEGIPELTADLEFTDESLEQIFPTEATPSEIGEHLSDDLLPSESLQETSEGAMAPDLADLWAEETRGEVESAIAEPVESALELNLDELDLQGGELGQELFEAPAGDLEPEPAVEMEGLFDQTTVQDLTDFAEQEEVNLPLSEGIEAGTLESLDDLLAIGLTPSPETEPSLELSELSDEMLGLSGFEPEAVTSETPEGEPGEDLSSIDWQSELATAAFGEGADAEAAFGELESLMAASEMDEMEQLLAATEASSGIEVGELPVVPSEPEGFLSAESDLLATADLTAPSILPTAGELEIPATEISDLEGLLGETESAASEFADLEALLGEVPTASAAPASESPALPSEAGFDELDAMLKEAEETLGGSPTVKGARNLISQTRRPARQGRVFSEQTMRVPVKHLDNLSNLVGELVVNRNSLEQDQERLRQSLDNLLYQVQQLGDVGQRMQDLYERSLLESSLLASRQHRLASSLAGREASHTATSSTGIEYDPLEMDRFTGFHSLSQEMIELIVRVRESASDIEFVVDETEQVTRTFRQVTTQLQEGLNRSRMVPFAQIADRLPRAVRDISIKVGKQAELLIEGRETLIDKMILEQLYDPMTHLVNNALTHGVEPPDVRRLAGKPPAGRINIRAFHQGNQTIISVSDDGAGIDVDRVKAKAIEKRLVTPAEAKSLSRLDVYDLLFHAGFSTKDQADDFSGRGVGMDVVRTCLNEIRGTITTDSTPGKGTTFTIRLPLTLSISKALCCISDHARIAFPMDGVEDMLDVPRDRIQTNAEGQPSIAWRDTILPVRPLSELLTYNRQLSRGSVYGGSQDDDIMSIVVLRSTGNYLALQVDQVLGEQEIVIKQLEGPVPKPVGIAGATVLGDGRIMPIADVLELIDLSMGRIRKDTGGSLWEHSAGQIVPEAPVTKSEPVVLIVDDSITVRELLSMTFIKVGYRVEQARDGQEAWEKLRAGLPCDIVFCDIEMPRMDGLELLSRLQKDPNLNRLPIAMLTSRGADRHRQMAASLGARGYFTKPYLEEALLDAAQRMLKGEVLINTGSV